MSTLIPESVSQIICYFVLGIKYTQLRYLVHYRTLNNLNISDKDFPPLVQYKQNTLHSTVLWAKCTLYKYLPGKVGPGDNCSLYNAVVTSGSSGFSLFTKLPDSLLMLKLVRWMKLLLIAPGSVVYSSVANLKITLLTN